MIKKIKSEREIIKVMELSTFFHRKAASKHKKQKFNPFSLLKKSQIGISKCRNFLLHNLNMRIKFVAYKLKN